MDKDTTKSRTIKVGGKVAGVMYGDCLRIEKRTPNQFSYKYQGYGVSVDTLIMAEAFGAKRLQLIGYDGEEFNLSLNQFRAAGTTDDLGQGRQIFLSVKWLRWYSNRVPASQQLQQALF